MSKKGKSELRNGENSKKFQKNVGFFSLNYILYMC